MKDTFNREVLKIVFRSELEPFNAAAEDALDDIVQFFNKLPDQEVLVLSMRWGIGEYDQPHTLEEVAECANCTRERVRQIEQRHLTSVRRRTHHLEGNVQRKIKLDGQK